MKKILKCVVTMHSGTVFVNELKLSEAYLISQLAQENKEVVVTFEEVTAEKYKSIFG